jgi:hypothetical protein
MNHPAHDFVTVGMRGLKAALVAPALPAYRAAPVWPD